MFGPITEPEIVGLLDCKLRTHSNHLTDIGWMPAFWNDNLEPAVTELTRSFLAHERKQKCREGVGRYKQHSDTNGSKAAGSMSWLSCAECLSAYHESNDDDTLSTVEEVRVPELTTDIRRIVDGGDTV